MKQQLCTATKEQELRALLKLWNASYPASLAHESVDDLISYLNGLTNCRHTFLWSKEEKGDLSAWFAVFEREGEPWFAMIVAEGHRKSGIGTKLIRTAQAEYNVLNGWVIDHDEAVWPMGADIRRHLHSTNDLVFRCWKQRESKRIGSLR